MADRATKIDNTQILDGTITADELNPSLAGLGIGGGAGTPLFVDLAEIGTEVLDVANDGFAFIDAGSGNVTKISTIANLITAIAGVGLTSTGGILDVDLSELPSATVNPASDSIPFIDSTDPSSVQTTIADFIGTIAGTGLTATSGVLSINESEIDHDLLLNFVANEHIDWTIDQGGSPIIHPNNVVPQLIANTASPTTNISAESSVELTMDILGDQYFIMDSNGDTTIAKNISGTNGIRLYVQQDGDGGSIRSGSAIINNVLNASTKVSSQTGLQVILLNQLGGDATATWKGILTQYSASDGTHTEYISHHINNIIQFNAIQTTLYGTKINLHLGHALGSGGDVGTYYGLHIGDTTVSGAGGSITTEYPIYQESLTGVNFFGSGIVIGFDTVGTANTVLGAGGSAVFNQQGADVDFNVRGDTVTDLFFVDASTDRVGIGTNTPSEILHVDGNLRLSSPLATHDYNITLREVIGLTSVAWQNQTSGTESAFEMYTTDGDGTDGCLFRFFAVGTPSGIVPGNYFEMGYVVGVGYVVRSQHLSHVSLPVSIGTVEGLHLTANTDGTIDIPNGELDMNDNSVGFIEQVLTIPSGGGVTIDWKRGNKASLVLTENVTFTFTDPSRPGNFILKISQGSGSNFTLTWPANVLWPRGITPALTAGTSTDVIAFYFDGTNYYGVMTKNFS